MKLLSLFIWLLLSFTYYAQWSQDTINTTNTLTDVQFVNDDIGFICEDHGKIFKTTDGGLNWTEQNSGTTDFLISISFTDENNGWALGKDNGTVIHTTDGGSTWTTLATGIGNYLLDIQFFRQNKNFGWIVGSDGQIYKTTDGGSNWVQQVSNTSADLWSVYFLNRNVGYAAGVGVILKTIDGGDTWTETFAGEAATYTQSFKSVFFTDENHGWAVGQEWHSQDAIIYYTENAGVSWSKQISGVSGFRLQSVHFVNKDIGFACGGEGTVLSTKDGGNNWSIEVTGTNNFLRDVYVIDSTNVYAVGINGTIIKKYFNLTIDWTRNTSNFEACSIQTITWKVFGVDNVRIEYTIDAGKNWILIEDSYPANIGYYNWTIPNTPSIYCKIKISDVANNKFYLLSPPDWHPKNDYDNPDFWYFTIYGTNKWEYVNVPTTSNLVGIKFSDENNGIAWGKDVLIATNDGGKTWDVVSNFESNAVSFADKYYGMKIINHYQDKDTSALLKTTDGGKTWKVLLKLSEHPLNCDVCDTDRRLKNISLLDKNIGWYSSVSNTYSMSTHVTETRLYPTTDGGESWNEDIIQNLPEGNLYKVSAYFLNKNFGWVNVRYAVSDAYELPDNAETFLTTDGGGSWENKATLSQGRNNISFFINENIGWKAAGPVYASTADGSEIRDNRVNLYKLNESGWVKLYEASLKGPIALYFISDSIGWFLGKAVDRCCLGSNEDEFPSYRFICMTKDGGVTWELQEFNLTKDFPKINNFFSLHGEVCWAVCDSGILLKYDLSNPNSIPNKFHRIIPDKYSLMQNYPNPFNPSTVIKFALPKETKVSLIIYNSLGEQITKLIDKQLKAGFHEVKFNNKNYSSGIYFYRLQAGKFVKTKKMILLK